ncbi:hypothetical protein B0H13DRAFT_1918341 [Mycena leptocephala]|nr:hypothetical protein B0H13DRAFT_1918341 [Mycena leptocephala]
MTIDTRYTAQQAEKWPKYHNANIAWANGEGRYPGPPLPGYTESYKMKHPMAAVPSDYSKLLRSMEQGPVRAMPAVPAVALTENALGMIVGMGQTFANTVGQLVSSHMGGVNAPTCAPPLMRGRPMMVGDRRFKKRNFHDHRRKGFKPKRAFRGPAKKPALKDRITESEPASDVATHGNSPVPNADMFDDLVIQEDVHMDDFLDIKDEDDEEGATGALAVGWDGGEPISGM